jgi:hypothetical protein
MSPPTPKRKKRIWVLAFGVCEKEKKNTHTHTQVVEKKSVFLHNIHSMGRSGQNGL